MLDTTKKLNNSSCCESKNTEYFINLETENSKLKNELEKSKKKVLWYEEQIKLWKERQYGKKSETLHLLQLPLFDEVEAEKESKTEEELETIKYTRKKSCRSENRYVQTGA